MGRVEDKLIVMIAEKYGTMLDFSKAIGVPNSTVFGIMKRGVNNAGIENVIKICDALGISVDELACGRIVKAGKSKKTSSDVADILEDILSMLNYDDVTFDGETLSRSEKFVVKSAVKIALEGVREERSET